MLSSLRIRNFALVDKLEWDVPKGFVAITGETGAGKSILIGGLQLLLGERADKSAVRSGEADAVIEAVVEVPERSGIPALLDEAGIDPCEGGQLLLRRVVSSAGSGRQFLNGSACTLALLRQIGDRLVDLHGPHDHQSLFSRDAQTRLLDSFAGARKAYDAYRAERKNWLALLGEKAERDSDEQVTLREIDLLDHQVREIEAAAPTPDDEEPLLARHRIAANAQRLGELGSQAGELLAESEQSIENRMIEAARLLREMGRLDASAEPRVGQANAILEEIRDLAGTVRSYADSIDSDPQTRAQIEARLDLIEGLKRKYGATVAEILAFGESAAERLDALRSREERRANLDAEIEAANQRVLETGRALSKLRRQSAPKLAREVEGHLRQLGFLKGGFEIRIEAGEPGSDGLETVEFLFAPNPGEPAQPLRAIASSGEISRVMLALKTSLASQDEVPVLVFDEIDANVGGEIAHAVAAKMREIGARRQVLCITHLPQVAATANAHVVVSKSVVDGRTISRLDPVAEKDREEEIARMLGSRQGEAALAHARELLS